MDNIGFQKHLVLSHMVLHDTLTSMEAIQKYGITRLAAVVFALKEDGWEIITIPTEGVNRWGRPTRYATYKIREASKNRYLEARK